MNLLSGGLNPVASDIRRIFAAASAAHGIARALALSLIHICDEPIWLDVSIQSQVVNLIEELQQQFNLRTSSWQ